MANKANIVVKEIANLKVTELAVDVGRAMAQQLFKERGNHTEIHLNGAEVAGMLAIAYELGRASSNV